MLFHIKYKILYTYLALIPAVFCVADTQASNLKDVGGALAKCKGSFIKDKTGTKAEIIQL